MGSSPFGFRTIIVGLLIASGAVQFQITFRKSLRLREYNHEQGEKVLPTRVGVPWERQQQHKNDAAAIDAKHRNHPMAEFENDDASEIAHSDKPEKIVDAMNSPGRKGNKARRQNIPNRLKLLWMDDVEHFFSHIPKSGSEYAHGELVHLHESTIRLPNNRTYTNVRAAQKRFDKTFEGNFLVANKEADQEFPIPVDTTGETDAYTPPLVCNQATTTYKSLQPYHVRRGIRYRCDFFVTEMPWNRAAENVYTIVREPFSHVLSQYFHCTESRDHKKFQDLMPSLNEWLESFANLTEANLSERELKRKSLELRRGFKCYNPIDSESEFTKFDRRLPENYTYPYPYTDDNGDRDETTKKLDMYLFDDLKRKYRVIGDTSRMIKSICAIFIAYTGGKHVPETCDCTNPRIAVDGSNNDTQFYVHNLRMDPTGEKNHKLYAIKMGYNPITHSHGVAHHGSSFLEELTRDQLELIAKLRRKDQVLYNVSRAVFDQQIREMEAGYGIKVCDKWNRPQRIYT